MKTTILETSGNHNPTEQKSQNEFVRNSKENINNWKNRLSQAEIQQIRAGTQEIADLYYSPDLW